MKEETKEKIRQTLLGRKQPKETIEKRRKKLIGNKHKSHKPISEESRKRYSIASKKRIKEQGHPMQGKHHSFEAKIKIGKSSEGRSFINRKPFSEKTKQKLSKITTENYLNGKMEFPKKRYRSGKRKDLWNIYFRTGFEANFARILKYLEIEFQYEKKVFRLSNRRRYIADFYLPKIDKYYELKGYPYNANENKYMLFKKDYPNIDWVFLRQDSIEWKRLNKYFKNKIKEWETKS